MHFHTQLESHHPCALSCLSHTDGSSAVHIPSHSHLTGEVDARDPRANFLMAPSFTDAWKLVLSPLDFGWIVNIDQWCDTGLQ